MAANNYLNVDNNSDRLTAFFSDKNEAYRALTELKLAGFSSNQIGLAAFNDDVSATKESAGSDSHMGDMRSDELDQHKSGQHHSFWQEVKDFFSGESHCGGDLRDNGFESYSQTTASEVGSKFAAPGNVADIGQRSIQLRGELLRAHKERVQRGEVRLRKEIVTENQTIEVPVTREELVMSVLSEIGSDSEIRIPLSEDRVTAEKHAVVNDEVRVGKREIVNTERVSDNVRHEELKVEENEVDRLRKPAA